MEIIVKNQYGDFSYDTDTKELIINEINTLGHGRDVRNEIRKLLEELKEKIEIYELSK
jgi:hypothetical protein